MVPCSANCVAKVCLIATMARYIHPEVVNRIGMVLKYLSYYSVVLVDSHGQIIDEDESIVLKTEVRVDPEYSKYYVFSNLDLEDSKGHHRTKT